MAGDDRRRTSPDSARAPLNELTPLVDALALIQAALEGDPSERMKVDGDHGLLGEMRAAKRERATALDVAREHRELDAAHYLSDEECQSKATAEIAAVRREIADQSAAIGRRFDALAEQVRRANIVRLPFKIQLPTGAFVALCLLIAVAATALLYTLGPGGTERVVSRAIHDVARRGTPAPVDAGR